MSRRIVTRALLDQVLDDIGGRCSGRVFLTGEDVQVYEGWRPWSDEILLWSDDADRSPWKSALQHARTTFGCAIIEEHPGEVIPLPDGYEERARSAGRIGGLTLFHFDPYSIAIRHIARGDEPDYHLVLDFMKHGWIDEVTLNALLQGLLPRFSMETIQQDPAEFRRKYKGLMQMAGRLEPGTVHRPF